MTTDYGYNDVVDGCCSRCGHRFVSGDYPFCPHGQSFAAIVKDEIPGGVWVENLGKQPVKVYSQSERRALAAAAGLEECVKWSGPGDQHVSRWAGIDPQTMENARVLVSRHQPPDDPPVVCESLEITVREL